MDTYEGEEIVVTARMADTGGGGGGWGGWGGWGGGWGGDFGGGGGGWDPYADPFGGDDLVFVPGQDIPAEATNPIYEVPQPETFLPYTVEQHPDGTVVVREYDFWTGQSNFVSIGPDGDTFTGSAPFDVNDWSNTPYLNFPDDGWSLAWA